MKKALLLSFLLLSLKAFSQTTVEHDTVSVVVNRGGSTIGTFIDNIINSGNKTTKINWNLSSSSVFPTGFNLTGICFLPGQCYNYTAPYNYSTIHIDSILGGSTGYYEPTITLDLNASLDSSAYLVINTDINGGKDIVFKVTATWPLSINQVENISIKAYPIPAIHNLIVSHNSNLVKSANVYSIIGKKVGTYITPQGEDSFFINVDDFVTGMYILELKDAYGKTLGVKRFSKR